ncbi:MAG: hypothetical protein M3415_07500 [Actinomycetota bacterium]|jgi:hypothetical protein|nr:hypothetical protein [Actinomycetota bacterium]
MQPADGADGWDAGGQRRSPGRWLGILTVVVAVAAAGWAVRVGSGVGPERDLRIDNRDPEEAGDQVSQEATAGVEFAGRRPLQYDNTGWWFCPPTAPIAAHVDRRFYPPTHPDPPPDGRRPAACFANGSAAAAADYSLAPPPADTRIVGGVYLVPTELFRLRCQSAADRLGHAVPCPRRLPYPPRTARCPGVGPDGCVVRRPSGGGFVLEAHGFPVPSGWCRACEAHVVVTAFRTGRPAAAGASGAGRSLRRWRFDGVTYAVSVAGAGRAQRALLRAFAGGVEMVSPSDQGS